MPSAKSSAKKPVKSAKPAKAKPAKAKLAKTKPVKAKPVQEVRLADYTPPAFLIDHVEMDVEILENLARVSTRLEIRRNPAAKDATAPLVLQGEEQKLIRVTRDGHEITAQGYHLTPHTLTIPGMPDSAVLEITSTHNPYANTALSGLYGSGPMVSTQCEPEGFRRITYYLDRSDVMAVFRVTIHADRKKYPVLLANGNLIATGDEPQGRHFAVWEDPHPKPCYLFAMVAGKLDKVVDTFKRKSGRPVMIEIYVEPGKTKETAFALAAIKKSMKWDEEAFGLEYDLDRFMMVATPFFNMGAMENKGLNIFNDSCVLGRSETATDATISFIERVVGHEYFHNWTGDRITCRDWFQLSLKEGLTVFREQEFMGDMHSVAVERLGNVRLLRRAQFSEDAGAMSHPVRPDRYKAIDNFYTATVYEKGAEVVRMIQTIVGRKGFKNGMDLYVRRHDGKAVTCDDFVAAMADANNADLKQFMLWYSQAGTPVVTVVSAYDEKAKTVRLTLTQTTPPTPGQKLKLPLHIPLAVGLLDTRGKDMLPTQILHLTKAKQEFVISGITTPPVLSLLRDFSAPVRLVYKQQTDDELLFLLAHDSDPFNRWEAGYKLLTKHLVAKITKQKKGEADEKKLIAALGNVLRDKQLDAAFKAMVLAIPGEGELGLSLRTEGHLIDVDAVFATRKALVVKIAKELKADFAAVHKELATLSPKASDGVSMGKRSLKNLCLSYLAYTGDKKSVTQVAAQAAKSSNMTDVVAAIGVLVDMEGTAKDRALKAFEKKWAKMPTIMDKWLALQAGAKRKGVLATVKKLMKHGAFDMKNPNRISALIGVFAGNGMGMHAKDGSGYKFVADMIIKIDPINPHSAAGLAKTFARWRDYDKKRQKQMQAQIKRIAKTKKLSANTAEVIERSLKG